MLGGDFGGRRAAQRVSASVDLAAQDLEHARGAALAVDRQAPERRPPRQHRPRAARERGHHVGAAPDPAVHQHLATPVDRLDHLGQQLERGRDAVELAPAVVGDDDPGGAVLDRQPRVLARLHALEQHGQRAIGGELGEVVPVSEASTSENTSWTLTARSEPIAAATAGR